MSVGRLWENNLELGILADNLGLEFCFRLLDGPVTRQTDFQGDSLKQLRGTGLLSKTNRINVLPRPTVFSSFGGCKAVCDHDSNWKGRFGKCCMRLNKPEYDMFGIQLSDFTMSDTNMEKAGSA